MEHKKGPIIVFLIFSFFIIISCDSPAPVNEKNKASANSTKKEVGLDLKSFLVSVYLQKKPISHGDVVLKDFETLRPYLTFRLKGGNFKGGRLDFNSAGRSMFTECYLVRKSDGGIFRVDFEDITKQEYFEKLRSVYREGGSIEILGFPDGLGVLKSSVKILIPGPSLDETYLIELLGAHDRPPDGFAFWDDLYAGKVLYRIYTINKSSGREGMAVGWIIDVVRKSVTFPGTTPRHLILKKFVVDKPFIRKFPDYLVTFPDGMVKENSKSYQYRGEVVDNNSMPVKTGLFLRFPMGTTYQCLNTKFGCRSN